VKDDRGGRSATNDGTIPAGLTRRRILQGAGGALAAAALPIERLTIRALPLRQESPKPSAAAATDFTGQ